MVSADGSTSLQRTTASIMVRIDGETVGISPVELSPGARIEFGSCRLTFEAESDAGAVEPVAHRPRGAVDSTTGSRVLSLGDGRRLRRESGVHASDARRTAGPTEAALVSARTGVRHPLTSRRIVIGRDESCDIVVRGSAVSRRHASIEPVAGGFMLRDESANGTMVNDVRTVGTYLLGHGDLVRIQDDEFRVELDASTPAPVIRSEMTTRLDLANIVAGSTEETARATAPQPISATLEIVRGPFARACFQVTRAVCSIGRGEGNDVRIRDDTVSSAHATLLLKRGSWFVVDLRSMNGTYVDGSRVSGERELHPGAQLRLGAVELVFRPLATDDVQTPDAPRRGLWSRVKTLLCIGVPRAA